MEKNEVRELLSEIIMRDIAKDIHDQNDLDVLLSTVSEGLRPSLLAKIKPYLDFPQAGERA